MDRATSKTQSMTITGQSTLDKKDIDQMVRDAEAHAEEDKQRREEAETRNNADSLVYQMEKVLRDNADKVDEAEKATIDAPLAALKAALNGSDMEAIKTAHEALMQASQSFSQKLYEKAAAENAAGTSAATGEGNPASGTGGDDDIIDAEIVDDESGK
jgi:molecular chaperone DnaK